jgi:nucleotide-binding universal stress UspA family protein
MPILCGTDFSTAASEAERAAASIARARGEDLWLVHVLDLPATLEPLGELEMDLGAARAELVRVEEERASERLAKEAARLASDGVRVHTEVAKGYVEEVLLSRAEGIHADCVVVAAVGRRPASRWALGSKADRLAQTSALPVLVVREARPFEEWLGGKRALRMLVALERSPATRAAVHWADSFAALGPCKRIGVHVYWPPDEARRAGLLPSTESPTKVLGRTIPLGSHPEIDAELAREFGAWLAEIPGGSDLDLRFVGGLGRPENHLVEVVRAEAIDLVVVGDHQRSGLSRLWHGSVSRGVIAQAPCNVACISSGPERA